MGSGGRGSRRISKGRLAGQYSASVLLVSHYGRPRDDLHTGYLDRALSVMARRSFWLPLDALDINAQSAISLYREYRGMDDVRTGKAAMDNLRRDADRSWIFPKRFVR